MGLGASIGDVLPKLDYWTIYLINKHVIESKLLDQRFKGKFGTATKIRKKYPEVVRYLSSVIAEVSLITEYLSVEWCGNSPKKRLNTYVPDAEDLKTKYEPDTSGQDLTEVDDDDDVMVFGIDKHGRREK